MFSLSPAVVTREIDLSAVVGAAPSSFGAFAGKFRWGPVNQPLLTADEPTLVNSFGKPTTKNAVDFLTLSSFFAYTSGAWVTRVGNTDMVNAHMPSDDAITVLNADAFSEVSGTLTSNTFFAKYPGKLGNSLGVAVCASPKQFELVVQSTSATTDFAIEFTDEDSKALRSTKLPITTTGDALVGDAFNAGDVLIVDGVKYVITKVNVDSLEIDRIYIGNKAPTEVRRLWRYYEEFGTAPIEDAFHVVVYDALGFFKQTGVVLETFKDVSISTEAKDDQGRTAYWEDVINATSSYIYAGEKTPAGEALKATDAIFTGGDDADASVGLDEYIRAYDLYSNAEVYDTPILFAGEAITSLSNEGAVLANYLIGTLAESRKDMLVFVSPPYEAVVNNKGREAYACVEARKLLGSSSYATMDCNWKYMYDKYNDTFRWVPCAGDHAGLYAQNDRERDPWVSAAGTSKGRLKNVVKFAWNPDKTARDVLYSNDVNPMFVMSIAGPVLFGDKTLLGKNTALSRNNVRRLLIVLEKTISTAAVDMLFEFNDEFTQRRFKSMVEPFLEDARGRRGLTDFKVICDETVNTPQVIQNNSFVGQIFIKPNYTISDIRLDFVVVNASASFEEVIGSY